jgi:hypothetical protein
VRTEKGSRKRWNARQASLVNLRMLARRGRWRVPTCSSKPNRLRPESHLRHIYHPPRSTLPYTVLSLSRRPVVYHTSTLHVNSTHVMPLLLPLRQPDFHASCKRRHAECRVRRRPPPNPKAGLSPDYDVGPPSPASPPRRRRQDQRLSFSLICSAPRQQAVPVARQLPPQSQESPWPTHRHPPSMP